MKLGMGVALAIGSAGLLGCQSPGPGAVADGTLVLNRDVTLRTEHNMVVRIRGQDGGHAHDYSVIFGPYPPGGGAFGEGKFINSAPTWVTSGGYTYAIGWWPVIKTPRVLAASEGTTVVIWLDPAFDRVFLLDPSTRRTRLNLSTTSTPATFAVLDREAYVEATGPIGGTITLSDVRDIPTSGEIREFLDYVLRTAATADLAD